MKVKIGNVWKLIPEGYWDAAQMIDESFITEPKRLRLSGMERFHLAELAWRLEQSEIIRDFLQYFTPVGVEIQVNRVAESRCVVNYKSDNGTKTQTIVPRAFRDVGVRPVYSNVNWHKT